MDNPLSFVDDGLAWYSIEGSFNELRQIAHCMYVYTVVVTNKDIRRRVMDAMYV